MSCGFDRPAYFYAPTILSQAEHGMQIVDEEQFGPAVPIISYRDIDSAVELANSTQNWAWRLSMGIG